MKLDDKSIVVKGNALVNAISEYKYSKNELKMICTLISQINNKFDCEFSKKWVRIADLDFGSVENTKHYTHCVKLCKKIMSKPFVIDGSIYNWFIKLTPKNGIIEYQFHEDLKPFLLQLNDQFTKYSLSDIISLNSEYSIIIYELVKQFQKSGKREGMTFNDLRKLLHIPESYQNKDVRRLIDNAQKEILEKTSIQFEYEIEKKGHQFNKITFIIKNNKKLLDVKYIH